MEAITFYPSRLKWTLLAAVSFAFTAAGVFLVAVYRGAAEILPVGTTSIFAFGAAFLVALNMLSGRNRLVLKADEFEVWSFGRLNIYRWSECEEFEIRKFGSNRSVVFRTTAPRLVRFKWLKKSVAVYDIWVPVYGTSAKKLAALMNERRMAGLGFR